MKMDGTDAGIILFIYFSISAYLAFLLFRYPQRIEIIALLSIFFFTFHFIDSAVTIQELSNGLNSFTGFTALQMVITTVVLAGHLTISRFCDMEKFFKEREQKNGLVSGIFKIKKI